MLENKENYLRKDLINLLVVNLAVAVIIVVFMAINAKTGLFANLAHDLMARLVG